MTTDSPMYLLDFRNGVVKPLDEKQSDGKGYDEAVDTGRGYAVAARGSAPGSHGEE